MTNFNETIQLPGSFIEKITRTFQQKGTEWLQSLPDLIHNCVQRWQLSHLKLSDELSYNLVLFTRHSEYGEVALKIGVPHLDLFSEIRAIGLFEGRGLCRCFDADESLGAMLLERILPGQNLWSLPDADERYRITAGIYRQMLVHPPAHHGLPLFADLISNALNRSAGTPETPAFLIERLRQAQADYAALESEFGPHVVLHCDLHHSNILRDEHVYEAGLGWRVSPGWRAIDPKGFVGARPIECARFIENELDLFQGSQRLPALDRMLTVFSDALGYPKHTLAQALTIDTVLSTFWSFEDHSPQESIESGNKQYELFCDYQKNLAVF